MSDKVIAPNTPSKQKKETHIACEGKIIELLPGSQFRVTLTDEKYNNHELRAYISGKMRKNRIRVLVGDLVQVNISKYNLKQGIIVERKDPHKTPKTTPQD